MCIRDRERRSIRRFKADQITDEELKTVLEAGTWAATGHGTQEPFIIAVQNPAICAQLRKMNAEIMGVEDVYKRQVVPFSFRQRSYENYFKLPKFWRIFYFYSSFARNC